jgi:hypothetical protein
MKALVKGFLRLCGQEPAALIEKLSRWSLGWALRQQGRMELIGRLRAIEPDLTNQEDEALKGKPHGPYWDLKRRGLQAFQCELMLGEVARLPDRAVTVADIGDSAGTHMLYLRRLVGGSRRVETVSVNLEARAVEKIRARGFKAVLGRAEDLDLGGACVDLFTSFEMVEHLHNPAIFFRRLARRDDRARLLLTVPFLRRSRVGLHNVRWGNPESIRAGDEHIFELSPEDWKLLFLHSGWRVVHEAVYYQYPRLPLLDGPLAWFWRRTDYEGFWGAVLEKDATFSDRYLDWEA